LKVIIFLAAWQPSEGFQYQGDVPDDDVDENAASQPPAFPELPKFNAVVPGYEQVVYSNAGIIMCHKFETYVTLMIIIISNSIKVCYMLLQYQL